LKIYAHKICNKNVIIIYYKIINIIKDAKLYIENIKNENQIERKRKKSENKPKNYSNNIKNYIFKKWCDRKRFESTNS
jgi:hypothetical protein